MSAQEILYELSFYVVHPNTELLALLAQYPNDSLTLYRPRLWANSEERVLSLDDEDQLALVKLIYLAKLRMNIRSHTDLGAKELGAKLLGAPPYNMAIFDRWWHIEKLLYGGNLWTKAAQVIPVDLLQSLMASDRPNVEGWLQNTIRHRQS